MKNKLMAIVILLSLLLGNFIDGRAWTRSETRIDERNALIDVGTNQATVTFGDLDAIGKALRSARKVRREDLEQQAEVFQPTMFDL